jgi:predicted nucleic-acid-binding Zn-ribbon protein
MRKTGICPKCTHNQLVHIGGVADTGDSAFEIRAMHLAIVSTGTSLFGGEERRRAGRLSAVMCRGCGYTELYVLDPESVQPDGKYITELNGPSSNEPYR